MRPHKPFFLDFLSKSKSLSNLILWQHFPGRESNAHFIILNHLQCCFWGKFGKASKQQDHINSRAGLEPSHLAFSPATQTASQRVCNQVDWQPVVLAGCPDPDQLPRTGDVCAALGLRHLGADNTSFSANIFLMEHMFSEGQGGVGQTGN